jgi:hypothetical protein
MTSGNNNNYKRNKLSRTSKKTSIPRQLLEIYENMKLKFSVKVWGMG